MATYKVSTQSSVNNMLLHSRMTESYITCNLDDARQVFKTEVEELKKQYATADEFEYSPSEKEEAHAIFCEIVTIDECDEFIESIEISDYYYTR